MARGSRGGADLSAAQARRIALGAQGLAGARPGGRVDRRHVRRLLDRVGLVQIDSVNVLVRWQELPWKGVYAIGREAPGLVDEVLAFVAERGPVTVGDLPEQGRRSSSMWGWSRGKRALEYLF